MNIVNSDINIVQDNLYMQNSIIENTENTESKIGTDIYCLYNDDRCMNDDCGIEYLEKFLNVYITIHLQDISINKIHLICGKCTNITNKKFDIIENGITWFDNERILLNERDDNNNTSNNVYLYIGNGYIHNYSDRRIVVMWNEDLTSRKCYYTINLSRFIFTKELQRYKVLEIYKILNMCLNEMFSKKEVISY